MYRMLGFYKNSFGLDVYEVSSNAVLWLTTLVRG